MNDDYPHDLGIVPRDPDEVRAQRRTAGARIRAVREERGLTQEALAAAAGWSVESLSAIEAGESSLSVCKLSDLLGPLHCSYGDLLGNGAKDDVAARALATVHSDWLLDDTLSATVRALAHWYTWDWRLGLRANPRGALKDKSLASRGAPAAAQDAFPRRTTTLVDAGWVAQGEGEWDPHRYARQSARVAPAILAAVGLPERAPVTAAHLAAAAGIPLGRRPLPDRVRAAAGNADQRPLLILNSERADHVTEDSALHMLVHVLCGQVTLAAVSVIGDGTDDDFGDCHGVGRDTCALAGYVARQLREGAAASEAAFAERVAQFSQDQPDRMDVETVSRASTDEGSNGSVEHDPDDYATYKVELYARPYRYLVDLDHPDMLGRGDGQTVVPAALAWRHVHVAASGLGALHPIDELGVDLPGHPSRADVVAADLANRTVDAQLTAWNNNGVRAAFTNIEC